VSTVVDCPAAGDIASLVTGGEVVPLASRATWLATGSGGAGTVTILALQFGTAGVVSAGLIGVDGAVSVAVGQGRTGRGTGTGDGPRRGGLLGVARRVADGARTSTGRSGTGRLRGLLGGGRWHQAGGRGSVRWPAPLVVAGEPAPAPVRHNAPIPPERIQHTQLTESPRAVFAGDSDSTDTSVMVDRWRSNARRSRITEFVKTTRTIRKNRDGIDTTIGRGLSNGRQEGGLCGTP
jgi:hypothetical protein